jgi:hypothetical protein
VPPKLNGNRLVSGTTWPGNNDYGLNACTPGAPNMSGKPVMQMSAGTEFGGTGDTLLGTVGRVTVSIPPDGPGEVLLPRQGRHGGVRRVVRRAHSEAQPHRRRRLHIGSVRLRHACVRRATTG